jgi:hypothetical protein
VPRRLLTPVLAIAAALALGAGCADEVSPGIRVGDAKISVDEVLDEVAEWTGNQATSFFQEPGGPESVTYPMDAVDALIQQRIELELHNQEFEALDLRIDDALRDQALQLLFQGDLSIADQALGGFSEEYATSYVDDIARQIAVQTELGDTAYGAWRVEALSGEDIEVNPRFGSWDPETQTVIGPEGPRDPVQPDPGGELLTPEGQ